MPRLITNLNAQRKCWGDWFNLSADLIAGALGWNESGARIERFPSDGHVLPTSLARASLAEQKAAIFAFSDDLLSASKINQVALLAYHSTIEWGLVADPERITIFNSHWIKASRWYSLPSITWDAADRNERLLDAFTPEGLTTGEIDEIASSIVRPDSQLVPVDDALVERLDHWRDEILRHANSLVNADELLQILFAQLFVLRSLEDRNMTALVTPLSTVLEGSEVNANQLSNIFAEASKAIQSELFESQIDLSGMPQYVLGGIIRDLYYPAQLPGPEYRYNFAWIEADILGRAYEKYLSTILVPKGLKSSQLQLWEQPKRDVDRISTARKSAGVYYTPSFLVGDLTEQCLEIYFADHQNDRNIPRIADISCGSGSFLAFAADALIRRLRLRDPNRNWGRTLIENKSIIGIDIDARAITFAKLQVWLRLTEEPDPLPLPSLNDVIIAGNSLLERTWEGLPKEFDIIVGNPPFIPAADIQSRSELAASFETARGKFDYSYLFVEMALRKLSNSGLLGLVIPNRLFRNRDADIIRNKITKEARLLSVTDFGAREIFKGTLAYIGSFVAQKIDANRQDNNNVHFVRIKKLPPRFIGAYLHEAREKQGELQNEYLHAFDVPEPTGPYRWNFLSQQSRLARMKLSENSELLPYFADIFQGIRTGANDIYIVYVVSESGGPIANIRNSFGDTDVIEREILRPMVMGSEVKRYGLAEPSRFLIYPYKEGVPLHDTEFMRDYPFAHSYLERYRDLLSQRETVNKGGKMWYELQRPRDLQWLTSSKLLSRDLASETSFAVDFAGATFLVGGTAIIPKDESNLLPLMGYLNSKVANWFISQSTPNFQADFQKYETQHFLSLPVPVEIFDNPEVSGALEDLVREVIQCFTDDDDVGQFATESKIDELLCDVTGIGLSELQ